MAFLSLALSAQTVGDHISVTPLPGGIHLDSVSYGGLTGQGLFKIGCSLVQGGFFVKSLFGG
ncbi:MAG: hypothetical protein A2V21_301265 [Deltaproteobacteria bacterium GWC2_55_46]|nr:MAG: hypothetical protein A2V21_301265 [Deltaproteobacteria bacterium GWC2_55_46]